LAVAPKATVTVNAVGKGDFSSTDRFKKKLMHRKHEKQLKQIASRRQDETLKMSKAITYRPVGVIRSEHTKPEKTPIQPD